MNINQARTILAAIFGAGFGCLLAHMGYGLATDEFWIALALFWSNGLLMGVK